MNLIDRIKEEKLVSESVLLLFIEANSSINGTISEYELPLMAYAVCLYCSTLFQLYFVKRLQNESGETNCFLTQNAVFGNKKLFQSLKKCWDGNSDYDMADETRLFSFLNNCSEIDDKNLILNEYFDENFKKLKTADLLNRIRRRYVSYRPKIGSNEDNPILISRHHIEDQDENDFIKLLEILPILKNTYFDCETKEVTIEYCIDNVTKEIKSRFEPFFYIYPRKCRDNILKYKYYLFSLTSIKKGEKDHQIDFITTNPFITRSDSYLRTKPERCSLRASEQNENEIAVCQTMGIETEWYPDDMYKGDYAFLKRLTDAIKNVIICNLPKDYSSFYLKTSEKEELVKLDCRSEIAELFSDEKITESIMTKTKIDIDNIDVMITELFILFGVFNVIYDFIITSQGKKVDYGEKVFHAIMNEFKTIDKKNKITPLPYNEYIKQCYDAIVERKKDLETIFAVIPKKSHQYEKRESEITAAWMTLCVLKSAGIKNENLFPDEEKILSIDDYFYMLINENVENDLVLMRLFRFITRFYKSLLESGTKSGEIISEKFISTSIKVLNEQNRLNETIEELANEFLNLILNSDCENNPIIENLIGRHTICTYADAYELVMDLLKKRQELFDSGKPVDFNLLRKEEQISKPFVFLCYSHHDKTLVDEDVKYLKKEGYNIIYDENFEKNWFDEDKILINSKNCSGVIFCMSRFSATSYPILNEIQITKAAQKNYILINYEEDRLQNVMESIYLGIQKVQCEESDYDKTALEINKLIRPESNIYLNRTNINFNCELLTKVESVLKRTIKPTLTDEYTKTIEYFLAFLKVGEKNLIEKKPSKAFSVEKINLSHCIYPMVVSVKETTIKRDCITLMGYEIVERKENKSNRELQYILSENKVIAGEYYCLPHYRKTSDCGKWMMDPLLISCSDFKT